MQCRHVAVTGRCPTNYVISAAVNHLCPVMDRTPHHLSRKARSHAASARTCSLLPVTLHNARGDRCGWQMLPTFHPHRSALMELCHTRPLTSDSSQPCRIRLSPRCSLGVSSCRAHLWLVSAIRLLRCPTGLFDFQPCCRRDLCVCSANIDYEFACFWRILETDGCSSAKGSWLLGRSANDKG